MKDAFISEKSTVPLALLITVVLFACGATAAVMAKLNAIESSIAELKGQSSDRWTGTDMRIFVLATQAKNPGLIFPTVTEVKARNFSP